MRVYYSANIGEVVVEGFRQTFAERSLSILAVDATNVEIWLATDPPRRLVGPVPYTKLRNQSNVAFADQATAVTQLTAEFSQQPENLEDVGDLVVLFENALL